MKLDIGIPPGGVPKSLDERIASVRARIAAAAQAVGRDPSSISLMGVTKKQPLECVLEAVRAGLHDIGESYVQEARLKYDTPLEGVRKHFIGHVQTNKAKAIVALFDVVQSVDRWDAGLALLKASVAQDKPIKALIQVNVSPTERYGTAPEDAESLAVRLREEGLAIDGVMAIGPVTEDRAELRRAFQCAAEAFACVGGSMFSVGMSGDFPEAIACGSTMVRIGTALFGARR
jgi:pyridoxal phosphate enzyme (YggS family)